MAVSVLPPLVIDWSEDWADFDDIKEVSQQAAGFFSPSSVFPVIDFRLRCPGPLYLAYVDDSQFELPALQKISIGDWIDNTSDDVVGGILELQAAGTLQSASPALAASVLLRIASFLFGEEIERRPAVLSNARLICEPCASPTYSHWTVDGQAA
eukprot:EG_transcript_14832